MRDQPACLRKVVLELSFGCGSSPQNITTAPDKNTAPVTDQKPLVIPSVKLATSPKPNAPMP
jgi:hypothetical protein